MPTLPCYAIARSDEAGAQDRLKFFSVAFQLARPVVSVDNRPALKLSNLLPLMKRGSDRQAPVNEPFRIPNDMIG